MRESLKWPADSRSDQKDQAETEGLTRTTGPLSPPQLGSTGLRHPSFNHRRDSVDAIGLPQLSANGQLFLGAQVMAARL